MDGHSPKPRFSNYRLKCVLGKAKGERPLGAIFTPFGAHKRNQSARRQALAVEDVGASQTEKLATSFRAYATRSARRQIP